LKKVTRIRVELVEVADDWNGPNHQFLAHEPKGKIEDRMADFYFDDVDDGGEPTNMWPVIFNIRSHHGAVTGCVLLGGLLEMAGTMVRLGVDHVMQNMKTGFIPND
jgi:hypothetical protein